MIAILLGTYNGSTYIREQLDSILDQSLQDFKIYVHDDGSTDNTLDIIDEYSEKFPDKISYVEGAKAGSSRDNFFYLMNKVEADYYMFCDQDDYWLPNKIQNCYERLLALSNNNDVPLLVFSNLKVVDSEKRVIDESFMHYNNLDPSKLGLNWLIMQNCAPGCTMLFNRCARDEALKYLCAPNPDYIFMHDCWLILVVAALGKLAYIEEPMMLYRQHSNNVLGAQKEVGVRHKLFMLWSLITLKQINRTRQRIKVCVMQASQLQVLDLQGEAREIVDGLCMFYKWNKIKRTQFIIKHKIYRTKRNLWQVMCL